MRCASTAGSLSYPGLAEGWVAPMPMNSLRAARPRRHPDPQCHDQPARSVPRLVLCRFLSRASRSHQRRLSPCQGRLSAHVRCRLLHRQGGGDRARQCPRHGGHGAWSDRQLHRPGRRNAAGRGGRHVGFSALGTGVGGAGDRLAGTRKLHRQRRDVRCPGGAHGQGCHRRNRSAVPQHMDRRGRRRRLERHRRQALLAHSNSPDDSKPNVPLSKRVMRSIS